VAVSLVVRPSRYLHYNAGAFVSDGEACLVDPGILREEVEALVRDVGGAELRYVVLTHADWDHVLGPEHLPPSTIVAHGTYAEELDPDGIRAVLRQLEERAGVARDTPLDPPLPALTFDATLELTVGALELQLEHAPGHAESMLTVHEPREACLWAADVLSDVEIPIVVHDLASYERTLARIAKLDLRTLVPGHGTATSDGTEIRTRLDEDRRYLEQLRETVAHAVTAGRSLEETAALSTSIPLRRSEDDETTHRLNVEKVYADLGGDADPDEVGFRRAWKAATRA
jgi:glyoxylase-like metal-dependent hydrolase (beta-lactamase superfamily II)